MTPRPHCPLVLVVLDGWGIRRDRTFNAIALARTPAYTELRDRFPHASLIASGEEVGLPAGQMGNSEVGHMNMGAGRVVYQDLTRIDKSIREGTFFEGPALCAAMDRCLGTPASLHLVGLVSDGGVHSHLRHLFALIRMAARRGVERVYVHAITDGRDTSPLGADGYLGELEQVMSHEGVGRVATVSGRYYAMDRDNRWQRTQLAYDAMVLGAGPRDRSARALVTASYAAGVTDEFIVPAVVTDGEGDPIATIRDDDPVIFFNFRADRARQLTRALAFAQFDGFVRARHPTVHLTTMTRYDATFDLPAAFPPQALSGSLAEVMVDHNLTNLRIAETEKYAHVTYFFNCGEERPYHGEDRILVPSPHVATYDLQPQMSAIGITDRLVADLATGVHNVVVCNLANADMVGHTGSLTATIDAVETLDTCLERIVKAVRAAGGTTLITADHGNAEQMWDAERNCPHTAHTSNPVPLIVVDGVAGARLREGGWLRDVAPTMLGLLGVERSAGMTGTSLIEGL